MKKRQIEFDFSKWGQEGITVETDGVKVLGLHQNPTTIYDYYGIDSRGITFLRNKSKLRMYQEIKPREIWVNEYPRHLGNTHNTKEEAEKCKTSSCIRTIKFREVLDDEQ